MRVTIEGLEQTGPCILVVVKGQTASAMLGDVVHDELQTKGEHIASRALCHMLTKHAGAQTNYSWLLPMADHERFSECLGGGVILAEETGTACRVAGTRDSGEARDVVRDIEAYLEQNT